VALLREETFKAYKLFTIYFSVRIINAWQTPSHSVSVHASFLLALSPKRKRQVYQYCMSWNFFFPQVNDNLETGIPVFFQQIVTLSHFCINILEAFDAKFLGYWIGRDGLIKRLLEVLAYLVLGDMLKILPIPSKFII
jgi:hypothetical protein